MRTALLGFAIAIVMAAPAAAAPRLVSVGNFDRPMFVTSPPKDSRVFVVEKPGRIKIVGRGTFLDISSLVRSTEEERGLLSMAFSPNYASNGLFYVFYTANPNGDVRVVQYKRSANPDRADAASAHPIYTVAHSAGNHNGGQLQFGPDGMLYLTIGDNASSGNAQNLSVPYGKILRIDPRTGGAAAGNPSHPEARIWGYGLRNPWRFSFDRTTGDLIIGDVGESTWEEIDWAPAPTRGRNFNYGWPDCEGPDPGTCPNEPVISHNHSDGWCAIVGGYVVRDPGLPTLNGRYLYSDNCKGEVWSAQARTGADDRATGLTVPGATSFGEDACGRIYAASLNGPVYRIQDGAATPCSFTGAGGGGGGGDTIAPAVKVSLAGVKTALKKRRLLVRVRCSEACRVAVGTRLMKVKRLSTRHRTLTAGHRKTVKLKLSKKVAKKLRKRVNRHRFVRIGVTVRATDLAGNTRTVHRHGRIKKKR
jgi:hypothetical protein